jgi:hypothetical protein
MRHGLGRGRAQRHRRGEVPREEAANGVELLPRKRIHDLLPILCARPARTRAGLPVFREYYGREVYGSM